MYALQLYRVVHRYGAFYGVFPLAFRRFGLTALAYSHTSQDVTFLTHYSM
jgi:hypothetical protein